MGPRGRLGSLGAERLVWGRGEQQSLDARARERRCGKVVQGGMGLDKRSSSKGKRLFKGFQGGRVRPDLIRRVEKEER